MADRRSEDQPAEDGGRYDWLYHGPARGGPAPEEPVAPSGPNDATRRVAATGPGPDDTRVLPVQPRPEAAAAAGAQPTARPSARPTPPPLAPTPPSDTRRGGGRSGRPRWVRVVLLVLLLWVVFLVAVPLWAWTQITQVDAEPDSDRPGDQPGTTYLLVGSDSREGLSEAERQELGTGDAAGQRTDTLMLLHLGDGPNLLMSIPRDSQVEIPGYDVEKINAAYAYGGPKLLVDTVEQATGIRVDHYVEIGFGGFVGLVDAVGGIEICPTEAMEDPEANLDIPKGCQDADGTTALGYARSRKTSSLGDIDRARHQREVVSAVGRKAVSPVTFLNPVRYVRVNTAAAESLAVDESTGPVDLARFAWAMTRVTGDQGLTCGVPIADLAVTWDAERAPELFQHVIDDDTGGIPDSLCTPSGLPG